MWDTAGQERFQSIIKAYYKGSHGAAIVFDLTDRSSFAGLEDWYHDIVKYCGEDTSMVLIGNKNDLETERKISYEEAKAWAEKFGMAYVETSAKEAINIQRAFDTIVLDMKEKRDGKVKRPEEKVKKVRLGEG
mmetsp:Transcript_34888/g.31409  ORF Transcript_34888/g.31409 Transcript_34888/m.31409 type:complete len:133 (-) Transcript_34888:155-553(-)